MNAAKIRQRMEEYMANTTPEQVIEQFEALGVEFINIEDLPSVYWEWYWGTDPTDLSKHSEKLKFTDFDEMKDFSAKHSYSCQHLKPNYWSSYDKIEI